MSEDATLSAYDQWHGSHEVDRETNSPWHQMIKERLRESSDLAGRRVLEIGCGRGGFACWMASQSPPPSRLIAADFSPAAVEKGKAYAASIGLTDIQWAVRNIEAIEEPDASFDTAVSLETIEHVPNPPQAVKELARVLKPGGRLYLTTPNYFSSIGLLRVYCYLRGKPFDEGGQPICQVTMVGKTRRWIRDAGLKIRFWDTCGHYLPFPGRPAIRMEWAEHPKPLVKHFGFHSIVVAEKPI